MYNTAPPLLGQNINSPAYWLSLNPKMSISDFPFKQSSPLDVSIQVIGNSLQQVKSEGYFQTQPVIDNESMSRLATAVQAVVRAGLPAVFAFVYDEYWALAGSIRPIVEPILGEAYLLSPGDMWIWHVDERGLSSGWGPHRDLQDTSTIRPDGLPRIITIWVPLTDATTLNGCMYLLPKHLDPNYPENLNDRAVSVAALQNIRALPADAGSILGWAPTVLHWGSRHSKKPVGPRISVAYYLNDGGHDHGCGISTRADTYVPLWYRLGVIGAMINLFDGSPLASDLKFPPELKALLQPFLDQVAPR